MPVRYAVGVKSPRPSAAPGRRRSLQAGFSILEVTMATFVMAFGIATSIVAMQTGFKSIDVARGTTLASQIIQSEIERIRMLSWSTVTAMDGTNPVNLSTMFTTDPTLASRFTVTRTVKEDETRPSDVRNIWIQVEWRGYDGRAHQRTFYTKYVKNGLYDYYYTLARP